MVTQNIPDKKLVRAVKFFLSRRPGPISKITNYDELEKKLSGYSNYGLRSKNKKLIVARMIKLNKTCANYWKLLIRLGNCNDGEFRLYLNLEETSCYSDSGIHKSICDRLISLTKNCTDYDELLKRKKNTNNFALCELIEARMTKLNDNCTDYHELYKRLEKDFLREEIEKRMIELNKIQLPKITDCDEFIKRTSYLDSSYFDFKPVFIEQFEARFNKLIKKKSFLIKLLKKGKSNLPEFLGERLILLAQKISQQ